MDGERDGRLSFLDKSLPPGFEFRLVPLAPGGTRPYDEAEWRGAIVVVERGEVELECAGGERLRLGRGAILWLSGLPILALRNSGSEPVVLSAVWRHRAELPAPDDDPGHLAVGAGFYPLERVPGWRYSRTTDSVGSSSTARSRRAT
jgi:hypothetical protein